MELEEAASRLRTLLDQAVARIRADAVLLSGGLDTSIIALIARRHVPKLKAFEDYLPPEVVWRRKTPIDVGTGAIRALRMR